jgi:hypothetical protein
LDLAKGEAYLREVFAGLYRRLRPNGRVVLYCNGVKNQEEYADLLEKCSVQFRIELSDRKRTLWSFRKYS